MDPKQNISYSELYAKCKDLVAQDASGLDRKAFKTNSDACFPVSAWVMLLTTHFLHTGR